jgi:hypothetical protein
MEWQKKGLVFSREIAEEYGLLNPQVPYAYRVNDRIRIFFGARKTGESFAGIYCIDVDILDPERILNVRKEPILTKGTFGAFDQDGVLPVCAKKIGDELYMYYGGFSKQIARSHTCMMGAAVSKNNGESFDRAFEGPILPISKTDPYLIGSADIIEYNGLYHMIYTSGTKWSLIENSPEISYTLKHAVSENGVDWTPTNRKVLEEETEYDAYAKPSIFRYNNLFVMYFSKRQIINYRQRGDSAYSLGYATSIDLINWKRNDGLGGLGVSKDGWDSEMICYPNIIELQNKYLMFYNGNNFGKSGFGYAELKNDI